MGKGLDAGGKEGRSGRQRERERKEQAERRGEDVLCAVLEALETSPKLASQTKVMGMDDAIGGEARFPHLRSVCQRPRGWEPPIVTESHRFRIAYRFASPPPPLPLSPPLTSTSHTRAPCTPQRSTRRPACSAVRYISLQSRAAAFPTPRASTNKMTKGTTSFGERHNKSHTVCRRCGRRSFHIQKGVCASCGYGGSTKMRRCK